MSQTPTPPPLPSPDDPRFQPGAPEHVTVAEARALDPQATYLRLTPECWDMVGAAYMNGVTAKQLAVKWKVSPTSIYRHAGLKGWTKKAKSRRIAAEASSRAAEAEARPPRGPLEPEPLDPLYEAEAVAALALGAVARCLQTGRYADAERMGRLAETMTRLARGPEPAPPKHDPFESDDDPKPVEDTRTAEELREQIKARFHILGPRLLARAERDAASRQTPLRPPP
jgi:hypothetical protein